MANDHDSDLGADIQALRRAAHLERARTLRRLLKELLGRRRTIEAWPASNPPALDGSR